MNYFNLTTIKLKAFGIKQKIELRNEISYLKVQTLYNIFNFQKKGHDRRKRGLCHKLLHYSLKKFVTATFNPEESEDNDYGDKSPPVKVKGTQ